MYDPMLVKPMREDLTRLGVKEMLTPDDVKSELDGLEGTALVIVNSVCGCAAANARPAYAMASQNEKQPTKALTVFAGMEKEATDMARSYFLGYPPSSPAMGLIKNGQVVFMLERHNIEGRMAEEIANDLKNAFNEHC